MSASLEYSRAERYDVRLSLGKVLYSVKLAVIGTGISGLSAAWMMRHRYDVTIYEQDHRLGGHTNTRMVTDPLGELAIDTGFIVHNDRNYPRLLALFGLLGVETQPSDMSFGASLDDGALEYAGDALFAQRRNLIRLSHWRMLMDIVRFNRLGKKALANGDLAGMSLGEWLDDHHFGPAFTARYLLPMAASIWSSPSDSIRSFSAAALLEFFQNHGLLDLRDRPAWRTVVGGSKQYLDRLLVDLDKRIQLNTGVVSVRRLAQGVEITDQTGQTKAFDGVLFASHADQSLAMLEDADEAERALLGAFEYRPNRALLHSDERLMPQRRTAWSSWNYLARSDQALPSVSVTYWMNRLQQLSAKRNYFVTLNPLIEPDPELVHYETLYTHPVFNQETRRAQASLGLLQGHRHCWYCGAWMGYGFHEDGLGAAIEAVVKLGVELPESLEAARVPGAPYMRNDAPWAGPGASLINA